MQRKISARSSGRQEAIRRAGRIESSLRSRHSKLCWRWPRRRNLRVSWPRFCQEGGNRWTRWFSDCWTCRRLDDGRTVGLHSVSFCSPAKTSTRWMS